MKTIVVVFLCSCLATRLTADVIDSSSSGFTSKNSLTIKAAPASVYRALVNDVGSWWGPSHTYSGDSKNLYLEDRAGGCFCERLSDGGSVRHLAVVYAQPPRALRMVGGLGPLQAMAVTGSMTWTISGTGTESAVEVVYAVGGYRPQGLQNLAGIVDRVVREQMERLKRFIETGTP